MTDDSNGPGTPAVAAVVLALVLALLVSDLVTDWREGVGTRHVAVEAGAALLSGAGVVLMAVQVARLARRQRALGERLLASQHEAERWRAEAGELAGGLRAAIDRQLASWQLSPAEREVTLLLLQGLGHKQIAARRGVSERTVRQQAHLLYRKIGISGRADLAAFFLGELVAERPGEERRAEKV